MRGRQRGIYPPISPPPAAPGLRSSRRALVGWLALPVVVGAAMWWLAITVVQIGCQAASVVGGRIRS